MKDADLCREIGSRIKELRIEKKMTQSRLCSDFITRNMLSNIENGKSMPSVPTLCRIAQVLETEPGYFLGDGDDIRQKRLTEIIKNDYAAGNYSICLEYSDEIPEENEELIGLKLGCYYRLGIESLNSGDFFTAKDYFDKASVTAYRNNRDYPYYNDCRMYSDYISGYRDGGITAAVMAASAHTGCISELPRFCLIYAMTVNKMAEAAESLTTLTEFGNSGYKLILNAEINSMAGKSELAGNLFSEALEYGLDPILSMICYGGIETCFAKAGNYEVAYSASRKKNDIAESLKSKSKK